MSVKKIHLFPSEESYVANSGSVDADDVALVPLNLAPVAKTGSFNSLSDKPKAYITETWEVVLVAIAFGVMDLLNSGEKSIYLERHRITHLHSKRHLKTLTTTFKLRRGVSRIDMLA